MSFWPILDRRARFVALLGCALTSCDQATDLARVDALAPDASADSGEAQSKDAVPSPGDDALGAPTLDSTFEADSSGDAAMRTEDGATPVDAAPDAAPPDGLAPPSTDAALAATPDVADSPPVAAADATPDAAPSPPDVAPDATPDAALPAPPDAAAPPVGPPPCDPPLSIEPSAGFVLPLDLLTFEARGGTGHWRFALEDEDGDAGLVNPLTGAYLSSEVPGRVEHIRLTDLECEGVAVASLTVAAPLVVHPSGGTVPVNARFQVRVEGGSQAFSYTLVRPPQGEIGSGAEVTPEGLYQAGPTPGVDQLRVDDLETAASVTVALEVAESPQLIAVPARIAVPVGSTFRPGLVGGTGEVDAELLGDSATFVDGALSGLTPGPGLLRLFDPFAGLRVEVPFDVVAPLHQALLRAGDNSFWPMPVGPGDVNGDGARDALLGISEADVAGMGSGAVYVYSGVLGEGGGLEVEPARVLTGSDRRDEFGRAVVTADFDGDGLTDLAVGAPGADVGAGDSGGVFIFPGVADGFFAESTSNVLSARVASDRTGQSLAACDFNGDGRVDLAVGAHLAEDRTAVPVANDQGGVFLWLGQEDGFTERPDQRVYGVVPNADGGWQGAPAIRAGAFVSAADFDGDGLCDLAVTASNYGSAPGRTVDGVVLLYLGRAPDALGQGGLTPLPVRAFGGLADFDPDSSLGRTTAMGDLDGDGLAELVVAQHTHDAVLGRNDNYGAVRVFRGAVFGPDVEPAAIWPAEVAELTLVGNDAADQIGLWVTVADFDGDGLLDLGSGHWRDELVGGTGDAGLVAIFAGRAGALPEVVPTRTLPGRNREERQGNAFASLGDVDGDGLPDWLAYAGRSPEEGLEVGAPFFVPGDAERPQVQLSHPGPPAGHEVGRAVEGLGDLDGDGHDEVLVSAPLSDSAVQGVNSGALYVHRGTPSGPETEPWMERFRGYPGHSASDGLASAVSRAGDFDRDGQPDFAALARNEDRPASVPAGYRGDVACLGGGALSDDGAVFLWRGTGGAPAALPAAVYHLPHRSAGPQALAGGVDVNGDGHDDLLVGADAADDLSGAAPVNDLGWFGIVSGRPLADGPIEILCSPLFEAMGLAASDGLGRAVAGIGDLDGDGCDEFAVSAFREANGGRAGQGLVRVFRGFGGPGCPARPEYAALLPGAANVNAGTSLAGGGDVDGDGLPDLVVGGPGYVGGVLSVGAAWVLPGSFLRTLVFTPWAPGVPPPTTTLFAAAGPGWRVEGQANGERFGVGLALVPPAPGDVRSRIAVGGVLGEFNGVARTGGVRVYRALPDGSGLEGPPVAALGGETGRAASRFGEAVSAGRFGGVPAVIVGAPEASALSIDSGAVYTFPVP